MMIKFKKHDFLAKQQALFLKELKTKLEDREFIAIGDLSENFSFFAKKLYKDNIGLEFTQYTHYSINLLLCKR
jgi:hypothetical protein